MRIDGACTHGPIDFARKGAAQGNADGLTTKEISTLLKMAETTAETYRFAPYQKSGVHNTAGLLAYAFRNGVYNGRLLFATGPWDRNDR